MAKLIRKMASEFTGFMISRLNAPRKKLRVSVTISLEPGGSDAKGKIISTKGETRDLSASGVALLIPSIRLCEKYLVGENRPIYAELDLPNGKIKMQLVGCRYEQLGMHVSVASYLIGAKIVSISRTDKALYDEYLEYGDSLKHAEEIVFTEEIPEC